MNFPPSISIQTFSFVYFVSQFLVVEMVHYVEYFLKFTYSLICKKVTPVFVYLFFFLSVFLRSYFYFFVCVFVCLFETEFVFSV